MEAISGISTSSEDIRINYLNLLVTQLRNQNPLEPMDNNEMASQLAQLSQLERLESIDNTFQKALVAARLSEAVAMIGKQVSFFPAGGSDAVEARVESVELSDGEVMLKAGSYTIGLDAIQSISD